MLQKKKMLLSALAVAGISFVGVNQTKADTTVSNFTDLQTALLTETGTITINGDIQADADLNAIVNSGVVITPGSSAVTLDGNNHIGFYVGDGISATVNGNNKLTFSNFKITSYDDNEGSTFHVAENGTLALNNIIATNNTTTGTTMGGVVGIDKGTLTNISGTFKGNSTSEDGGVIYNFNGSIGSISGTFGGTGDGEGNSSPYGGGVMYSFGGTIGSISGSFINNFAPLGGVMWVRSAVGTYIDSDTPDLTKTAVSGTFKGNSAERGGAIFNLGRISKISAVFGGTGEGEGNITTSVGGAIYNNNEGARIFQIEGSEFTNNRASSGGAIYNIGTIGDVNNSDTIAISSTAFTGNTAVYTSGYSGNGGAIFSNSTITQISGSTFTNNQAGKKGGAIYNDLYGVINNIDSTNTFTNNSAEDGGALYAVKGSSGQSSVIYSIAATYTNNTATNNGGAIYNGGKIGIFDVDGNPDLTKTAISGTYKGNKATGTSSRGGAIYNTNRITKIADATFGGTGDGEGNSAQNGGAICNDGSEAIIDSINATFINNSATGSGGAINNAIGHGKIGIFDGDGNPDLTKTAIAGTFKGNTADVYGGAIINDGIITKIDATFGGANASDGNTAERGGAIYNAGDIYSINGTFKNNSTSGRGGGAIYNYVNKKIGVFDGEGNPDLTKTAISGTFENNSATTADSTFGGAILNNSGIITKIANATFTGNTAVQGGAIANYEYYTTGSYGKIYSISGTFINNTVTNVGGAIYNGVRCTIGDTTDLTETAISGTFKGNTAIMDTWYGHGGAIENDEGTITKIDATFGGTNASDGNSAIAGGAISNIGATSGTTKNSRIYSINGTFTNNTATKRGGAISNENKNAVIGDMDNLATTAISGTFKSNKATGTDGMGGAIYNNGDITKIVANFGGTNASDGNTAANGGAIYNDENGVISSLSGTFTSNSATGKGGAIYNRYNVSLVASDSDIAFEKNTDGNGYNDIHQNHTSLSSNLNLNANTGNSITFNGTITGDGTSTGHNFININKGSSNIGGSYTFNNGVSGNEIKIYNGASVKLGSTTQANSSKTYGLFTLDSLTNDTYNGTIDMQNEKYNDANNFGKMTLSSALNIKLDIDASTTTPTSDTITVASNSSGVLNINSIDLKGVGSDLDEITAAVAAGTVKDFTLQVLSGNDANSYLTINSDLKNAFHNESISTDEYTEDIMPTSNSINWNAQYGEYTYKIKTTKDINIYGGTGTTDNGLKNALKFATTESHYDEHITNQVDNLAVINTYSGTGSDNRRIRFNGIHTSDAHGVYTMMENTALGETTAGTMTLAGVMSTGANPVRTTVDLNGNSGYDLTTNATELVLQNLILTNNKANEAIITVGNTGSKVTLNNSVVDGDIDGSSLGTSLFTMTTSNTSGVTGDVSNANIVNSGDLTLGGNVSGAISNTSSLTLQGSTLNANVTGSGKSVIDGDVELTAGKTIAQDVEINSGKSLTAATTGLTGTNDIKNDGALVFNNTANGTIAQNIVKNATGGTVEIAAADNIKVALATGKTITNNTLTLTSGIFDATNRADDDGNIDLTSDFGTGIVANGGTLSVQDDKQGAINLGAVNTDNSALSIAIDAQFTTGEYEEDVFVGTADKITATISDSNNKIDVSNIKITADPVATTFKAQIADAASADNISLSAATLTGLSEQAGSVLLGYDKTTGYLKGGNSDLDNAIISTIPIKMYSMGDNEIDNSAGALTLNGTSLSITGNDKTIISTSNTEGGIVIDNNGQTLSIAGAGFGSDEHYFTTAIDNTAGGTVNLTDVTFNEKNTTAVVNNGTGTKGLFLNGTNEFNSGITGTGKTNVVGGTTTFNADVTQSNLEIKPAATLINNDALTVTEAIVNYGALTNSSTIASNSLDNVGTVTNYGGSTITVNTNINNYGENGDIENAGSILAQNINNAATINNANGGTITATNTFGNSNTVNSNGDILANALNNTGTFTNFADGNVTVNTTILNDSTGTFDSAGDVLAKDIVNNGIFANANGGTVTATGTLTNTKTFGNNGEVNTNALTNTNAFTNYENGVVNVNTTLANFGDNANIANLGKINAQDINNAKDITNYGNAEITATNDFINSGALTNLADAKITVLNKLTNLGENGDIENAGSILAAEIENTATVNNANGGSITATGKLTNSNIFNSNGDVAANAMDNTGTFTNFANGTVTVNTDINNYGENGDIENAGSILAQNINNAATINNANGGTITATNTFGNSNTVNSNGDILANALNNTGTFTNFADGNVTVNTTILNDSTGTFNNLGNVLAQDVQNDGVVNNANGGTYIATSDLNTTNEFNNDGSVAANTLENSGTFTNDVNGLVNVNTTLTNEGSGTFNNSGIVNATDILNDGTVNNSYGGNITAANNISNTNEFNTDGYVSADSVYNAGTFTNTEHGIVEAADQFVNINQVNNSGVINTTTLANDVGAVITNDWVINAYENFNNDGIINNTAEGQGALNIKNGYSNDAITQGTINIAADNTAFNNNAQMTVEQFLYNEGTLNNTSNINVENSIKNATLDNRGVINTKADSTITANRLNNTDAIINMTKAALTVTDQDQDIEGTINVKGAKASEDVSEMAIAGTNPVFTGTLNVGDLSDASVKSTLKFLAGDIEDKATVNIAKGNVLNVAQDTSKGEDAYAILNENDTFKGDVVLDNGTVEMRNVSYTTGDKSTTKGGELPYYEQNGGNLVLSNSALTMKDSSKISDGNMQVDTSSVFNSEKNGFNLNTLANGGLVNAINGDYEHYGAKTLLAGDGKKDKQGDFNIDIYARANDNKKYDDFGSSSSKITAANGKSGVINISDWSLNGDLMGGDAPIDRNIELDVFKGSASKVRFTATDKEVFTPLGWYKLNNPTGRSGKYSLDLARFNPQAYRGQVTTLAQWQNQLAIDDLLFTHSMVLPGIKDNEYGMAYSSMANKYASTDPAYAPYQYSRKDGGLWVKAYGNFEKLEMTRNIGKVGNNAYGSLIGADFGLKDLRNGWKFMPTAYIGYNGAHQHFNGISAYQNGMQAGMMGTWYKNNFMVGGLAYGGVYDNIIDLPIGNTDRTFNYFAGASTKASYNIKLHKDFAVQPNLFLAYNFFGQQNFHTDFGQMGMMSGTLNGVNLAPGVNLIWEKETFSIYGTLQYMYNLNGAVGGRGGNVDMPRLAMERGYIQYGLGATKKFTDRASGYFQSVLRNVGRTGVGFQAGFQFKIGKDYSNVPTKKTYIKPKNTQNNVQQSKTTLIRRNNQISLLKQQNDSFQYIKVYTKA